MKITVNSKQYTVVAIIPETYTVTKFFIFNKILTKTMVYVYDRERTPHVFNINEVERYD